MKVFLTSFVKPGTQGQCLLFQFYKVCYGVSTWGCSIDLDLPSKVVGFIKMRYKSNFGLVFESEYGQFVEDRPTSKMLFNIALFTHSLVNFYALNLIYSEPFGWSE